MIDARLFPASITVVPESLTYRSLHYVQAPDGDDSKGDRHEQTAFTDGCCAAACSGCCQ